MRRLRGGLVVGVVKNCVRANALAYDILQGIAKTEGLDV
jgi:hypothetical protein